MIILRSIVKHGNVLPSAYSALTQIPEDKLHNISHSRRHPVSLYSRSLSSVQQAWLSALDLQRQFEFEFLWRNNEDLLPTVLDKYKTLLFLLYEHIDAIYGCVRALFPPQSANDPLLDTQFLDRLNPPGWRAFRSKIKPYLNNRLGAVVNSLKHNQSETAWLYLTNNSDIRLGYYIRDVQPSSFARDMLLHYWNLYFISNAFSELIRQNVPGLEVYASEERNDDSLNTKWEILAERMSSVPPAFFPDEVSMPFPLVRWNKSTRELTLQFPSAARPRRIPSKYTIKSSLEVDMAHPNNKMPYFGANAA